LCVELSECSFLDLLWQVRTVGGLHKLRAADHAYFPAGAQQLVDGLADRLPGRIHSGSPVLRIEQSAAWVLVITACFTWQARQVIVAVPPALASRIEYEPALPHSRSHLLRGLIQPSVIKCVAVYEEPFWRDDGLSGHSVTEDGP